MLGHFRKCAWLAVACAVVASLAVGTILAHEGRPVGDYRFIVGWLEEPAYEGDRNAVSVQVNKVVEGGEVEDGGQDHHGGSSDNGSSSENGEGMADHHSVPAEAGSHISVEMEATLDIVSGVNIRIIPHGFNFAPENVNGDHVDGEGHAHVYVDGQKLIRVYTPWLHLDKLEPGMREIKISLNANSHEAYTVNGELVEAVALTEVPEASTGMMPHGSDYIEAEGPMRVDFRLEPDPLGGANLFITETAGLTFAPENTSGEHVAGQGHAHVYVNGVKVSRVYGDAFQLGQLAEGMNEVRVTLNANNHPQYTWNGEPVEAAKTIHIEAGMGGAGYGESSSEHGEGHSSIAPQLPKVLASVAAQHETIVPVEGLEGSMQVEVTHVPSGVSRVFDLKAVFGEPGHYVVNLVPTAAGVYEFRVFGDIEGTALDETFASSGGGGGFDDIRTSAGLHFPEELPELREIESGVRGAIQTAQEAQDAALAAQEGGGNTLAIIALIVGIVGVVLGLGGTWFGLRGRRS